MPNVQDLVLLPQGGHGLLPVVAAAIAKTQAVLATLDTEGNLIIWDIPSGKQLADLLLTAWERNVSEQENKQATHQFNSKQLHPSQLKPHQLVIEQDTLFAYGRNVVFQFDLSLVYDGPIAPKQVYFFGHPTADEIELKLLGDQSQEERLLKTGRFTFAYDCDLGALSAQKKFYMCTDSKAGTLFIFPIDLNSSESHFTFSSTDLGFAVHSIVALAYQEEHKALAIVSKDEKEAHSVYFLSLEQPLKKKKPQPIKAPFWLSPEADYVWWLDWTAWKKGQADRKPILYRTNRTSGKKKIGALPNFGDILQLDYYPDLDYLIVGGFRELVVFHVATLARKFRLNQPGFSGQSPSGSILANKYKSLELSPDGRLLVNVPSWLTGEQLKSANGPIYLGNIERNSLAKQLNTPSAKVKKVEISTRNLGKNVSSPEYLNIFLDNGAIFTMQLSGGFSTQTKRISQGYKTGYYAASSHPVTDVIALLEFEGKRRSKKTGSLQLIEGGRKTSHALGEALSLQQIAYSPDGRFIAVAEGRLRLMIYQADSLTLEKAWDFELMPECEDNEVEFKEMLFHPRQQLLAVARAHDAFIVEIAIYDWSMGEKEPKRIFHQHQALQQSQAFAFDFGQSGKYFIFRADNTARIWELKGLDFEEKFLKENIALQDQAAKISREQLLSQNLISEKYANTANSPVLLGENDDFLLIENSKEKTIEIWPFEELAAHLKSGLESSSVKVIDTSAIPYHSLVIMQQQPVILFYRERDEWIKLVNWESQEFLGTIYAFDANKFLIVNTDNYYFTSATGYGLAAFKLEQKIFPMEQFDLMINRPDKVLSSFKLSKPEEIQTYVEAFEKRMLKVLEARMKQAFDLVPETVFDDFLGKMLELFKGTVQNDSFELTEIEILNRKAIEKDSSSRNLEFQARITTANAREKLLRLNVYINDVPIYGKGGIPLQWGKMAFYMEETKLSLRKCNNDVDVILREHKGQLVFDFTINCALSNGQNKVQIAVLNMDGIESFQTFFINYRASYQPKLYFIGIAVGLHMDEKLKLDFPEIDLEKVIRSLKNKFEDQPDQLIVQTITQEVVENQAGELRVKPITKDEVGKTGLQQIRDFLETQKEHLKKALVDDKVILFYSGHGKRDTALDLILSTYDMDLKNFSNVLPYSELEAFMDGIIPRNKLLILDACESGELDIADLRSRSFLDFTGKERVNLVFQILKEHFIDLRRGSGATIIAASDGNQDAKDSILAKNIIAAFEQKKKRVSELTHYLIEEVPKFQVKNILRHIDLEDSVKIALEKEILDLINLKLSKRQLIQALKALQLKFPINVDMAELITKNLQQPNLRAENISNDWEIF